MVGYNAQFYNKIADIAIFLLFSWAIYCIRTIIIMDDESQYSTVVLTVVRVMIAKYRKSGIWGYRSSLTPEPIELK